MEQLGIVVNTKKIMRLLILLVIGLSMMFYGVIGYFAQKIEIANTLSDAEIIKRATELGLTDPREQLLEQDENNSK
jgi:hypothetical protein